MVCPLKDACYPACGSFLTRSEGVHTVMRSPRRWRNQAINTARLAWRRNAGIFNALISRQSPATATP